MTPTQVARLVDLVENEEPLESFQRLEIAGYIRASAPLTVLQELEQPILDLIKNCERCGQHGELTHSARNALEKLYGYQVLHYV